MGVSKEQPLLKRHMLRFPKFARDSFKDARNRMTVRETKLVLFSSNKRLKRAKLEIMNTADSELKLDYDDYKVSIYRIFFLAFSLSSLFLEAHSFCADGKTANQTLDSRPGCSTSFLESSHETKGSQANSRPWSYQAGGVTIV